MVRFGDGIEGLGGCGNLAVIEIPLIRVGRGSFGCDAENRAMSCLNGLGLRPCRNRDRDNDLQSGFLAQHVFPARVQCHAVVACLTGLFHVDDDEGRVFSRYRFAVEEPLV